MAGTADIGQPSLEKVSAELGLSVGQVLGGRASLNWLVRRGEQELVLRAHRPAAWQTQNELGHAVAWRVQARRQVLRLGWPAAQPIGDPLLRDDIWWTIEEFLPGTTGSLTPKLHAELLSGFHGLRTDTAALGVQPGRLNHLAVLTDTTAETTIGGCTSSEDRRWLLLRLEQARVLASGIDWAASPAVLVHGDFASHNLLFEGAGLSGVLDFELATVDRRAVDFIHVWRCRYDDVVFAYDGINPLTPSEWRMLLVDWWALLVSLAVVQLRLGRQPDRWELDGLRRNSDLSRHLEAAS